MKENLVEAYEKFVLPAGKPDEDIQLLVDGGPENYNSAVDGFVDDKAVSLKRLLAQTDIIFSNSMVEAVNKVVKYQFLFHHDIADFNALERYLVFVVPDYNNRPHSGLGGCTPKQIMTGQYPDYDIIAAQMKMARIKRIEQNRKAGCGVCG